MPNLVEEKSNVFLIKTDDGRVEPRPKTYRNKLRFNHNYEFTAGTTFELITQPFVQVTILETGFDVTVGLSKEAAETVFVSDNSEQSKSLERGLYEALVEEDYTTITNETFPEIRRKILEQAVEMLFPRNSVQIAEDGAIIEDIYKVSWDGQLFLNQVQNTSYRPGVSGVEEINEEPEFLEVDFDLDAQFKGEPAAEVVKEVLHKHVGVLLTDDEIETLTLVQFILHRKEMTDDELFWTQTEKSVLVEQSNFTDIDS